MNYEYQLLPYIDTMLVYRYFKEGVPMFKSHWSILDQRTIKPILERIEFIFGEQILICPVLRNQCRKTKDVYT